MGKNGGKRPGAGRPKGKKNATTLEKERVFEEVRQRIMKNAQRILDGQMSLARGQQFLYVIRTETDAKGKKTRSRPELVTDPEVIAAFLDGEYGDGDDLNDDEHYY